MKVHEAQLGPVRGLLSSTLVCEQFPLETIAQWLPAAAGWTLISRDGIIVEAQGLIYAFQTERKSQFAASRKREMETVQDQWSVLEIEIKEMIQKLASLEAAYESSQEVVKSAYTRKSETNYQSESLTREINRLSKRVKLF